MMRKVDLRARDGAVARRFGENMRAHYTGDEGSPTFANTTTVAVGDYCAIASERAKFSVHTSKARKIVPHFTRREHLGNARQSKVSDTAYKGRVLPIPAHFPM